MLRYHYITYFSLLLTIIQSLSAQHSLLKHADSLYEEDLYEVAITEYKRFLFFYPNDTLSRYAGLQLAKSYRLNGEYEHASRLLREQLAVHHEPVHRSQLRIELALTYLLHMKYSDAEFELKRLLSTEIPDDKKEIAYYYLGIATLNQLRWHDSSEWFELLANHIDDTDKSLELHDIINKILKGGDLPLYSPSIAKCLSTFIPGAGFLYLGEYNLALNALLLNSLTFYWNISMVVKRNIPDSLLAFYFVSLRYYLGGRKRVEEFAIEKNKLLQDEYLHVMMRELRLFTIHW